MPPLTVGFEQEWYQIAQDSFCSRYRTCLDTFSNLYTECETHQILTCLIYRVYPIPLIIFFPSKKKQCSCCLFFPPIHNNNNNGVYIEMLQNAILLNSQDL